MSNFKGDPGPAPARSTISFTNGVTRTEIELRGAPAQVIGQFSPLTAFCNEVEYEQVSGEPYATVRGRFYGSSGDPGGTGEKSIDRWSLNYREHSLSIFNSNEANRMESLQTGAKRLVQIAVKNYQDDEAAAMGGPYTPAEFAGITNPTALALANEMFALIVSDTTEFRYWQPIVVLSYDVPYNYSGLPRQVPRRPVIYPSTNALTSAVGIPNAILFALPQGEWLEIPPNVTTASEFTFEISQSWEFAESYSTFLYPQT